MSGSGRRWDWRTSARPKEVVVFLCCSPFRFDPGGCPGRLDRARRGSCGLRGDGGRYLWAGWGDLWAPGPRGRAGRREEEDEDGERKQKRENRRTWDEESATVDIRGGEQGSPGGERASKDSDGPFRGRGPWRTEERGSSSSSSDSTTRGVYPGRCSAVANNEKRISADISNRREQWWRRWEVIETCV